MLHALSYKLQETMDPEQLFPTSFNSPDQQPIKPTHHRGRWALFALIAVIVVVGAFRFGYVTGKSGYVFVPKEFKVINQGDQPQTVDYSLFWKALDIVQQKYIDREHIDQQKVLFGAIRGAVSAAGDEYTEFFDPETLANFRTELQGSFSGIGAEIGKRNNNIVIVAPLKDAPAEKAGLRANDIIVTINGESTVDMQLDQAVSKIRGPEGSEVTLNLFREGGEETFEVKIVRAKIEIKSVEWEYKEVNGKQIAVITISRFGDDTRDLFLQAINDIRSKSVAGIVVDVRNNPGGYLDTSVEVASQWLASGKLVVTEDHSTEEDTVYNSKGYNLLGNYKTIVLLNGGSASAAEILAGALRDNNKAQLIGEKSFGKGSVQELVPLGETMAVKVTIAKWITPSGKNLNKDGLAPDIEVKLSDEDINNNRDPQLDRALQEVAK